MMPGADPFGPRLHTITLRDSHPTAQHQAAGPLRHLGREFSGHGTVNHSANEYVRTGGFHHTNTVESFFALLKRAVYGQFHHISEAHLHRYLAEADFKYNHRTALGIDDAERAEALLRGAKGKRLYYRQPNEAPNA